MTKQDGIPGILKAGPQQQVPMRITREMVIHMAAIQVVDHPDGGGRKILRFVCPDGLAIGVPLDTQGIEAVVQGLRGTGLTVHRSGTIPGL